MTSARRILLVSYFYPPLPSVGARRPAALAKYLARAGHEVTVLTSTTSGQPLEEQDRVTVVHAGDLLETRLNWRRARQHGATHGGDATWHPGTNVWGAIVVPDLQLVTWLPAALRHALRIARATRPDIVITTSPTETAHLVGAALRRRGMPWIADLRDGWSYESVRSEWPTKLQSGLDHRIEASVLARADAVVCVTEPMAADISRRFSRPAVTITNGFDPEDAPPVRQSSGLLSPERRSLVYTGGLGPAHSLEPLLEGAAKIRANGVAVDDRLELVLAGALTPAERARFARPDAELLVRHVGFLDRDRALMLQREADALLLTTEPGRLSEASGKLYEYLASGRPILLFGTESAAAQIVGDRRAGVVLPRDGDAAAAALVRVLSGELESPPSDAAAPYLYPTLVERYQGLIERVLAERR